MKATINTGRNRKPEIAMNFNAISVEGAQAIALDAAKSMAQASNMEVDCRFTYTDTRQVNRYGEVVR